MPLSITKQSNTPAIYEQLTTSTSLEEHLRWSTTNYHRLWWVQHILTKSFWFFVNMKVIAKKTTAPSFVTSWITLENFILEIKQISWSCPDPIFFKNKYPNPILIQKNRMNPAGYPILILFILTSAAHPPFCAARWPAFSATGRPAENSCFYVGNPAVQPAGPPFSVIPQNSLLYCFPNV